MNTAYFILPVNLSAHNRKVRPQHWWLCRLLFPLSFRTMPSVFVEQRWGGEGVVEHHLPLRFPPCYDISKRLHLQYGKLACDNFYKIRFTLNFPKLCLKDKQTSIITLSGSTKKSPLHYRQIRWCGRGIVISVHWVCERTTLPCGVCGICNAYILLTSQHSHLVSSFKIVVRYLTITHVLFLSLHLETAKNEFPIKPCCNTLGI